MIIVTIGESQSNIMVVQLLHLNVKVDARYIRGDDPLRGHNFSFSVNGRTLKITRTGGEDADEGWPCEFRLRVYLPTEDIHDFTSTVYTYHGLDGERAPKGVTKVIFHPSVNTIQNCAFYGCKSLVRVTIPDYVTTIDDAAFMYSDFLTSIQFPRNLERIGRSAFYNCTSLERVYLPPTITHIGGWAFHECTSLRFFHVPEEIEHIGHDVVLGCHRLLTTVKYKFHVDHDEELCSTINEYEVNQWLMQRHVNCHLHRACCSTLITPHEIEGCIQERGIERATEVDDQQMTALHILCANPHVTGDAIRSYLQLAPEAAANAQYGTGKTGLHIICSLPYQDTFTGDAIRSYLNLAPEAAEQQDSDGMTPFQYLWNRDDTFLEDRDFSSLMAWWYCCMPPQIETGTKRKRG